MRPFFSYYGAKGKMSARLPSPRYGRIVEAFAGSACYATTWPDEAEVVLCDLSPKLCALWRWLISASRREILSLPDLPPGGSLKDLDLREEARWLIGLRIGRGDVLPRNRWSPFALWKPSDTKAAWSPFVRSWMADQVERIRHWQVVEGSYASLPNHLATWIVDPPYQGRAGRRYPCGADGIDFDHLATWTRKRNGLVVVHEGPDATWFPEAQVVGSTSSAQVRAGRDVRSLERLAIFDTLTREKNLAAPASALYVEDEVRRAIRGARLPEEEP